MKKVIEGADLIKEIGKKVKDEFDESKLPLMLAMINCILEDKKLIIMGEFLIYYNEKTLFCFIFCLIRICFNDWRTKKVE